MVYFFGLPIVVALAWIPKLPHHFSILILLAFLSTFTGLFVFSQVVAGGKRVGGMLEIPYYTQLHVIVIIIAQSFTFLTKSPCLISCDVVV